MICHIAIFWSRARHLNVSDDHSWQLTSCIRWRWSYRYGNARQCSVLVMF